MVRPILKAYLWLAALWSCGAVLHAMMPAIPEGVGLVAGLAVAAWYLGPILRRAAVWLGLDREPASAELVPVEGNVSGS